MPPSSARLHCFAALLTFLAAGCDSGMLSGPAGDAQAPGDAAAPDVSDAPATEDTPALDAPPDAAPSPDASPDASPTADAATSPDADAPPPALVDGAEVRTATIPTLLACGAAASLTLVMANTGTSTWTPADYALVAVDGSDPLASSPRATLASPVPPGGTATFTITGAAPSSGGAYVSDWRMARGATAFGATASRAVAVNCPGVDSIDLRGATILASPPGAPGWPITAQVTALDIAPTGGVGNGGIVPDFTRKDGPMRWPDVRFLGGMDSVYYTVWLVLNIRGRWFAAGAQQYWYDNSLRMCGIPSGWTSNLFYDAGRWAEMSRYPIAPGEIMGLFVAAGDHRSRTDTDGSTVLERSAVVLFPFPGDTAVTYRF
ncbi:MAG: NBR1-Ig-like domain-containing protein [Polyangiales bacterium]